MTRPRPETATGLPVLFVLDCDRDAGSVIAPALKRRFGADYRVVTADTPMAGMQTLRLLAQSGEKVALLAAGLRLPDTDGVAFLEAAHALHRTASRVALVAMDESRTRFPFAELGTLQRAMALGRIDFWVVKGWVTPEEWFYPQIQEALSAWTISNSRRHLVYRIVGEQWAPGSHDLRDMLTRSSVPFEFHRADSDIGRQLIREFSIDASSLPAVIHHDGRVLHNPSFTDIAAAHGIRTEAAPGVYDLVILGAGPSGLASAVYGASEGLRTLVLEMSALGGQAGTSSMIRNYLGFPRGIGGSELVHRAWEQAVLLGAHFVFTRQATQLESRGQERVVHTDDGREVVTRSVILAAGVTYRRLEIPALERLVGAGVFYGAAGVEAPAMAGEDVYVVGGANSAGQAALHLAKFAHCVTLLVRGQTLAAGMSDYLVRQIQATQNIDVRVRTRITGAKGESGLQALTLENMQTGGREQVSAAAVFVMIGAQPRTAWLREVVELDPQGFILTGRDIPADAWHLDRAPLPFETSLAGVFAAGDVRYGSIKRVAGAVGEGSVTVGSVHQYLAGAS